MLSNHMHRVQLGGGGKNSYSLSIIKIDATSNTILNHYCKVFGRYINVSHKCGVDIFWPHHLPSRFLV